MQDQSPRKSSRLRQKRKEERKKKRKESGQASDEDDSSDTGAAGQTPKKGKEKDPDYESEDDADQPKRKKTRQEQQEIQLPPARLVRPPGGVPGAPPRYRAGAAKTTETTSTQKTTETRSTTKTTETSSIQASQQPQTQQQPTPLSEGDTTSDPDDPGYILTRPRALQSRRSAGAEALRESKCQDDCDCERKTLQELKDAMTTKEGHCTMLMIGEN